MSQAIEVTAPPLAIYKPLSEYTPKFSDFVVRVKWMTIQFGLVTSWNKRAGTVSIITESTPKLLLTLTDAEMQKRTIEVLLDNIRNKVGGSWSILQSTDGKQLWYV